MIRHSLALRRELRVGAIVLCLRLRDHRLNPIDLLGRSLGFGRGGLGRSLGFDPTSVEEKRLHASDLVGQLAVALSGARLSSELRSALLLVRQNFADACEIRLRCSQLLLGILAPCVKPGNSGRFLEQQSPLDGLRGDDRADLALTDERRRMRASCSVGEKESNILRSNVAAVDPVGRTRAPLEFDA